MKPKAPVTVAEAVGDRSPTADQVVLVKPWLDFLARLAVQQMATREFPLPGLNDKPKKDK